MMQQKNTYRFYRDLKDNLAAHRAAPDMFPNPFDNERIRFRASTRRPIFYSNKAGTDAVDGGHLYPEAAARVGAVPVGLVAGQHAGQHYPGQ